MSEPQTVLVGSLPTPETPPDSVRLVAEDGVARWVSIESLGQASLVTLANIRAIIERYWTEEKVDAREVIVRIETELNRAEECR